MKYTEIDERIDLDNQMNEIAKNFPVNDDDLMIYIRCKVSTKELFVASTGEAHVMLRAIFNIALQNKIIKEQLFLAVELLKSKDKLN